ncbi:MAG: hypothetical protein VB016_06475 [Methanomassiliicoccaceae archaeon]|nr:hypothetical protein [Methanomassiliicoccaceae archaeon]
MAAKKGKSVVSLMLVTVVVTIVIASLGYIVLKDYDATIYEYEVTGTHQYENLNGDIVTTALWGDVSTTYMDILGENRVTTTSNISYHDADTNTDKVYELQKRWSFTSSPDYGILNSSITGYSTSNFGQKDVDLYVHSDENTGEVIKRWVGQDDGIVYRVERTISNDGLITIINQELKEYGPTKLPLDI